MEKIKISEALREMQARTKAGNVLMYVILAVAVTVYVTTGRGVVSVELAMSALVLGVMQYLWQGFSLELFVRHLERTHQEEFDSYPDHISNGGWIIYVLKMILTILAAIEMILSV